MSQGWAVLRGGRVLDPAADAAPPADILIEGGRISEIGAPGLAAPEGARLVDAADRLLIPGLVNAHTHGHGSLAKGWGDRATLELLLNAGPWISGQRNLDDKRLAARLNAAEMLRRGCTAAYDLFLEIPTPTPEGVTAVAESYAEVGVRAVVAPMMADRSLYEAVPGLLDAMPRHLRRRVERLRAAPFEESLSMARDLLDSWAIDRARLRPALAPTIPLHCSDAFLLACRDLAADYDVGLHMHLAESKVQAISGLSVYGKTLTAHLDELGLLGPRFTAAHGNWLDGDDIARLADNGASVAHNPGSNLRLGTGIAPVRRMRDGGLTVGVGTDGSSSADSQNMFEALRLAAYVSRVRTADYRDWIGAGEAFEMATAGGARALGFDGEIGRLAPGYKADIVFLDLASFNYLPLNDALNQVVFCENGSAVAAVMVDGVMVLEAGRLLNVDEARLRREVEAAVERLRGATREARALAEKLADYVGLHCVGLAREPYHVNAHCG